MKCKKCRKPIPDDSRFCCYCGAPQAAKPKMQLSARTAARMIDIVFFMLIISFVF